MSAESAVRTMQASRASEPGAMSLVPATRRDWSRRVVAVCMACAGLLACLPTAAHAQRTFEDLPSDPVLAQLVEQTLATLPELRGARDTVRAETERVPQAGALPDPVLTVGLQNDSFTSYQVGKMETSWWRIELNQPLPWPGKRGLRTDVAKVAVDRAEAYVARLRLSAEASVRRAYLELILVRDRSALLDQLEAVWTKSVEIARGRYQTGLTAQSDVYRAELELSRLRQRRFILVAEERRAVQTINRYRGRDLAEPIVTTSHVTDFPVPTVLSLEDAVRDAEARSPELSAAHLGVAQAQKQVALASRERFPDMSVGAGVMPRGGLPPMWSASVSIGLPVWARKKQGPAVSESSARASAQAHDAASVGQTVRLQVADRMAALAAISETLTVYREGLLAQSEATVESTLAQYQVGRVTFASVLEANIGYLNDREGYLLAATQAQKIAIADAEVALEATDLSAGGASGMAGGVPGQSTLTPSIGAMGNAPANAAPASTGGGASAPSM